MSNVIEFVFDFGSPNAYFSYKILPPILQRTGATLEIIPCLLGGIFKATGKQAPFASYGHVQNEMDYEQKEMQRFIEEHQLTAFQFNPHFPINTLTLMRGAVAAAEDGALERYIDAGLAAMWESGLKMDDSGVFVGAMNEAGLDGQALFEKTQDPAIKEQLIRNTDEAVARGAFGIPTFFVGDEMFFGKDRLQQVEAELSR